MLRVISRALCADRSVSVALSHQHVVCEHRMRSAQNVKRVLIERRSFERRASDLKDFLSAVDVEARIALILTIDEVRIDFRDSERFDD